MTPQEHFEVRDADLKKEWAAGHLPALFDAVREAQINNRTLPEWAALAILNLIVDRFNAAGGPKRRSRYMVDHIHWMRWDTLAFMFRKRGLVYAKRSGSPEKGQRDIQAARRDAVQWLDQTVARGTPRQMQDSFDLVEAARASGQDARFTYAR